MTLLDVSYPLSLEYPTLTLEEFVESTHIGPVTAVAKKTADYRLLEEAYHPAFSPLTRKKIVAGNLAYSIQRKDDAQIERILADQPRHGLTEREVYQISEAVLSSNPKNPHRFVLMIKHYDLLRKLEEDVRDDEYTEDESHLQRFIARQSDGSLRPEELSEICRRRALEKHETWREGFAIHFSKGEYEKAQEYARKLHTSPVRDPELAQVLNYLNQGGEETLRCRGAFRFGTNRYFWQDAVGTPEHHGRAYGFVAAYAKEIKMGLVLGVAQGALWALSHPGEVAHMAQQIVHR